MGSSCCKSSEKNNDKPLEIAPKESGSTKPADTTEMKDGSSSDVKVSIHPPSEIPKLTESSGKSSKQNEMAKSACDSKSSLKISLKDSGPIDSANIPKTTEMKPGSSSGVKIPVQPPLEIPKLAESSGKLLKQNEMGKSALDSKSSLKISLKESGPIDSADIPKTTEMKTASRSAVKIPAKPPSETPKFIKSNSESWSDMGPNPFNWNLYTHPEIRLDPYDTTDEDAKRNRNSSITADPLSRALSKFASSLYSKIESDTNVVFSPLSIALALALLEQGASGKTREEILKLISPINHESPTSCVSDIDCGQYGDLQDKILQFQKEHGQLFIANSVFLDTDYSIAIKATYLQSVKKYFNNRPIKAPFEKDTEKARQQINQWISKKTMGTIPELFGPDSLEKETAVLSVNAIYMKVEWERKFDVDKTRELTFYRGPELGEQKAKFMFGDGRCVSMYMGRKDFHAVELPCKGGTMSMYIILPRDRDGIKELEKKINADFLIDMFKNTRSVVTHYYLGHVNLRLVIIPKFTVRFKTSMLPTLAKLGFRTLHELERMVDRSQIPDNRRILQIPDIVHEAYIKVDEEGGDAATVAEVVGPISTAWGGESPIIHFVADHPFVFVIAHKPTLSVVLMGKVESVDNE